MQVGQPSRALQKPKGHPSLQTASEQMRDVPSGPLALPPGELAPLVPDSPRLPPVGLGGPVPGSPVAPPVAVSAESAVVVGSPGAVPACSLSVWPPHAHIQAAAAATVIRLKPTHRA